MSLELPEDWRSELPVEMQSSGVLENVKNIETLAKIAIDGRNFRSTAIRLPSTDASVDDRNKFNTELMAKLPNLIAKPNPDEAWDDVWNRLGRPKNSADYDLGSVPDQIKESMTALTGKAHDLGVTQDQMKGIADAITSDYEGKLDLAAGSRDQHVNRLKDEWGGTYNEKVSSLGHFVKQTGFSEDFVTAVESGQLNLDDMKALDKVLKGFEGEGVNIGRQPNDQSSVMTPSEATLRIAELWADKDGPLLNNSHPDHDAAVKRNFELHKYAEVGRKKNETDAFRASLDT